MTDVILVVIIQSVTSLIIVILTAIVNKRLKTVHKQINSRMDELLAINKKLSNAEGNKEGRLEQTAEKKAENNDK